MLPDTYPRLTTLQSFTLQLARLPVQKVDQTYVALYADSTADQLGQEEIQIRNDYMSRRFVTAVLGKEQLSLQSPFQQVTLESATIFIKEVTQPDNKSIRLIYLPLTKQDSSDSKIPQSYKNLVLQFFLFNKFLKPDSTKMITLISLSYLQKPAVGMGGKVQKMTLLPHIQQTVEQLKKWFNLKCQQIWAKVIFIVDVEEKREKIVFSDSINKGKKIYILTNDEDQRIPLHALDAGQDAFRLKKQPTELLGKNNHLETEQVHLHFHYNRFFNYTPRSIKQNFLDRDVAEELWAVIVGLMQPIHKVKQLIYDTYSLETEAFQPAQNNKKPAEYPQSEIWTSQFQIPNDFKAINRIFGIERWTQLQSTPQPNYLTKPQFDTPKPKIASQIITRYQPFNELNIKFANQTQNLVHAMLLDQINQLSKELKQKSDQITSQNQPIKRYLMERKMLDFSKVIVRFLESIKNHRLFAGLLENYESAFYEHLIEIYSQAYDEFCWANNLVYGKLFDLSQKITDLKSSKKEILKVVKGIKKVQRIDKMENHSIPELEKRKQLLSILLNLLEQNKSNQRDKDVDTKIMDTKYNLGSVCEKLAVVQDFGNSNSQQLQEALKLIFNDLYKYLFLDNKNFTSEYADRVEFTEMDLLIKTSGILKALGRLDLSIEIEKKQGNHSMIENYFNRWLMNYRINTTQKDYEESKKILLQAVDYFKLKFFPEKAKHYFNLLILNSRTLEQKAQFENLRLDYENELIDPVVRKKSIEKAKKTVFPLLPEVVKEICIISQKKY